jgi:hypothetical protein
MEECELSVSHTGCGKGLVVLLVEAAALEFLAGPRDGIRRLVSLSGLQ